MHTRSLLLRIPIGAARSLSYSLGEESSLDWDYVAAHVSPDWLLPGTVGADVSVDISDGYSRLSGSGAAHEPRERIEHFPGQWVLRRTTKETVDLVDLEGRYSIRSSGVPTRHVSIVRSGGAPAPARLFLRVVRDLMHHQLLSSGYLMLHAAVVCRDGVGVAFMGDKGAGKSSWMVRALASGWNLIANDRVYVHADSMDVVAFPIAALLSWETIEHLPQHLREAISADTILRRDHHTPGYSKVGLAPLELSRAFGVKLASHCRLGKVVILTNTSEPLEAVISRNVYSPRDPTYALELLSKELAKQAQPNILVTALRRRCHALSHDWTRFNASFETGARNLEALVAPFAFREFAQPPC